jgi:hypothetical protein
VYLTSNYFFWSFEMKGHEIGLKKDHVFFLFLEQQQDYMNQLLLGLSFFIVFGLSFWGLILSHRVAGPLFRLHKHMWAVAKGEVTTKVNFRQKDFFQELTRAYNAQYDYLKYGIPPKDPTIGESQEPQSHKDDNSQPQDRQVS